MAINGKGTNDIVNIQQYMGFEPDIVGCEACDWRYLVPKVNADTNRLPPCPHCFEERLISIRDELPELPPIFPPEAQIPFTADEAIVRSEINRFSKGIPFAPTDLSAEKLIDRLSKMYLPVWWVDSQVQARWELEAGFNYQVRSYQDQYDQNRGGWISNQVTEQRVRWEPRVGGLDRTYTNIPVSAVEGKIEADDWLFADRQNKVEPYMQEKLADAMVRLPDRPPEDAWSEAIPKLRAAAANECRMAIQADHQRNFHWHPEYLNQNWTMMLYPAYSSYYLDDEGKHQTVMINGLTGEMRGDRRASPRRARGYAVRILVVSGVMFILGLLTSILGSVIPGMLILGVLGLTASLFIGLGALVPIAMAWNFNRMQVIGEGDAYSQ
jgi:hypothetical protein